MQDSTARVEHTNTFSPGDCWTSREWRTEVKTSLDHMTSEIFVRYVLKQSDICSQQTSNCAVQKTILRGKLKIYETPLQGTSFNEYREVVELLNYRVEQLLLN